MAGKRTPITGINKDFAERWNEAERELIGSPAFPRGHTQVSLGKAIGISGPQVCAARNGDTIPERPTLVAFCRLTGVSMEWLQTGVGPKYPVPDSEFIDIARDLSKLLPEHQGKTPRAHAVDALPPVARNSNPALVAELRRMLALAESGQIVSVFGGATTPSGDVVPIVVNRPASRPKLRLIRRP